MRPGSTCTCQHCDTYLNHATLQRACGHFLCPSCLSCDDDIVALLNPETGEGDTIPEDTENISHVKVTVEGPADDVAEVVEAIDKMMEEQFSLIMRKRVTRTNDETPA